MGSGTDALMAFFDNVASIRKPDAPPVGEEVVGQKKAKAPVLCTGGKRTRVQYPLHAS
jgi:hypothetical protein